MTTFTPRRVPLVLVLTLVVLCSFARPSMAQMSYSAFTDMWGGSDASTVFGYAEMDDLAGCQSGGQTVSTDLISPTRYATAPSSSVGMAFDNEEGNWDVVGHFSVNCNCSPSGGGHTFTMAKAETWYLSFKQTYYGNGERSGIMCTHTTLACSSGTPTCAWGVSFALYPTSVVCPEFAWAIWLTAQKVGVGTTLCLWSVSGAAGGPGKCT